MRGNAYGLSWSDILGLAFQRRRTNVHCEKSGVTYAVVFLLLGKGFISSA